MAKVYETTWYEGFIRPTLQRHGDSERKRAEEDALLRLCEQTADECPDIAALIIR